MKKKKDIVIQTNMRSSLILSIALLLTIACTSITQALKREYGHGRSDGDEIMVKSAQAQNPLTYMPSGAIDKTAVAHEVAESSSNTAHYPKRSIYETYSADSSSSSSSGNIITGVNTHHGINNIASTSSAAGVLGHLFEGFSGISGEVASDSGCGCGKKSSESLEIKDLKKVSNQGKIVPSFEPIGDMCYPSKNAEAEITTKVTPAHPGKIKYSSVPTKICLKVVNGKIDPTDLKKLGSLIGYSTINTASAFGFGASSHSKPEKYISSNTGNIIGGSSNFGGHASSSASSLKGHGITETSNNDRYSGSSSSSHSFTGYGVSGLNNIGAYSGSSSSASSFGKYGLTGINNFGGSNSISSSFAKYDTLDNTDAITELTETESNCDNGHYPQLPADPVSLALAYKNFFPQSVVYNKKFVPEDKLAFGHRTLPIEAMSKGKVSNIPEEKLQVLDKPIVELKPMSPIPISVSKYNEQEEAKLAELEAIERERIKQEEMAEQQQGNIITYGDLGYTPINKKTQNKFSRLKDSVTTNVIDTEESDCGPIGPPIPGYAPGSVVIHQHFKRKNEVENEIQKNNKEYVSRYFDKKTNNNEDKPTSHIFARLQNAARNYESSTCSQ